MQLALETDSRSPTHVRSVTIDVNLHRSMCTITLHSFLLPTELFLPGIVCQTLWYLQARLKFLNIVYTISGETKCVRMTGMPACPESAAEVLLKVF